MKLIGRKHKQKLEKTKKRNFKDKHEKWKKAWKDPILLHISNYNLIFYSNWQVSRECKDSQMWSKLKEPRNDEIQNKTSD